MVHLTEVEITPLQVFDILVLILLNLLIQKGGQTLLFRENAEQLSISLAILFNKPLASSSLKGGFCHTNS